MSQVSFVAPRGWTAVDLGDDPRRAISAAVESMFADADRDSSAVAKHWMRERLTQASQAPEEARSQVVGLLLASSPVAGVTLPMSAQILRLDQDLMRGEPMRELAFLASRDASSHLVEVGHGVVLRTHEVRDVSAALRSEVENAVADEQERSAILGEADAVSSLRVRYFLPGRVGQPWHIVAFTAMIGNDDSELSDLYLGLADAFVQAMQVEEAHA